MINNKFNIGDIVIYTGYRQKYWKHYKQHTISWITYDGNNNFIGYILEPDFIRVKENEIISISDYRLEKLQKIISLI